MISFRCKACNKRLLEEELYTMDDTDWFCRDCNQVSTDAYRELMGYPPLFGNDRK